MISQEACDIIGYTFVVLVYAVKYLFVILVAVILYGTLRNYMIIKSLVKNLKKKKEGETDGRTRKKRTRT